MRLLPLCCCLLLLSACGGGESAAPKLAGAERNDLPVFEPSTVEATESFPVTTGDELSGFQHFSATAWELSTTRPLAAVLAFYEDAAEPVAPQPAPVAETSSSVEMPPDWQWYGSEADQVVEVKEPEQPVQVFLLPPRDGVEAEISVELLPRQRRYWFRIVERMPTAGK